MIDRLENVIFKTWFNCVSYKHNDCVITYSCGWRAERTKIRIIASKEDGGSPISSFAMSQTNAWHRVGLYSE